MPDSKEFHHSTHILLLTEENLISLYSDCGHKS